ncbi:hypothetical protein LSTR_LSTR013921 [Laodelphax striatellus]|uniref:Uncharacterized protein n=1 Tax=Laodelphax striatellus TaxID=195883 RepID=A0A482X3L3_LAOST|nr:hypothetical protein LSTR_LSTR013921 [Laodelphax striatellus]
MSEKNCDSGIVINTSEMNSDSPIIDHFMSEMNRDSPIVHSMSEMNSDSPIIDHFMSEMNRDSPIVHSMSEMNSDSPIVHSMSGKNSDSPCLISIINNVSEKNSGSPSVTKKREFLNPQAKEIIYKLHNFMRTESNEGPILINQPQARLSLALGVSTRTIQRVCSEFKMNNGQSAPRKPRLRKKTRTELNDYEKSIVRATIAEHAEDLTLKKLSLILKEKINFNGSVSSLRRVVKELGFQYKKGNDNRKDGKWLFGKPTMRGPKD